MLKGLHLTPSTTKKGVARGVDLTVYTTHGTVALTHFPVTRKLASFAWGPEQVQAAVQAAPPLGPSESVDRMAGGVFGTGKDAM